MDTEVIKFELLDKIKALGLPRAPMDDPYLVYHATGDGRRASPKWNIRVYHNSKCQLKMVTTDKFTLEEMLAGNTPPDLPVVQIDDSGWGFPIGGVMMGAMANNRIVTEIVPVEYFQGKNFTDRRYMHQVVSASAHLLKRLHVYPNTHRVEICTGPINEDTKTFLREYGYYVSVAEITGPLQNSLMNQFYEYAEDLMATVDTRMEGIKHRQTNKVVQWIYQNPERRMKIAKTGWAAFQKQRVVA